MADNAQPVKQCDGITIHYIKANSFRVVHADGAHGGITPRGKIQVAFFNDRSPIPQKTMRAIEGDKLGEEKPIEFKQGIVREVEVEIVMDLGTAKSVHAWLGHKVEHAAKLLEQIQESQP